MVPGVGWNTVQDDLANELKMKHPNELTVSGNRKAERFQVAFTC